MSFADELAKLQRTRRAYVRFAREGNPEGSWIGDLDRRYGKVDDPSGDVPVRGTVENFGSFTSALANTEFPLEVPTTQTSFTDPDREWRALGDRPSNLLLQRRLEYYLRQEDDDQEILDQLVAIGQIGKPTFPSGKCSVSISVPGGDFLGETLGRRLLTTKDWPRALPDDLGKVIPFVYGRLVNAPPVVTETTITLPGTPGTPGTTPPPPTGGCAACNIESWSGDLTLLFNETFESYGGSQAAASLVWLSPGVWLRDTPAYSGTWSAGNANTVIARPVGPIIAGVFVFGMQVYWTGNAPSAEGAFFFTQHGNNNGFNTQVTWGFLPSGEVRMFVGPAGGSIDITSGAVMIRNQWNCFTGAARVSQDGAYRIYVNGALVIEDNHVDLTGGLYHGTYEERVGGVNCGLGDNYWVDNIWCATAADFDTTFFCGDDPPPPVDPEPPTEGTPPTIVTTFVSECPETDGVTDQGAAGRGGWLRGLLVDTGGGTTAISDYPLPDGTSAALQPSAHAAPTLSGTLQAGGSGAVGTTVYYVAATVHPDGTLSDLSNIVGPFTIDSVNRQVQLTFSGLAAGADSIRVWRNQDSTFEQMDRYRVSGYPYSVSDLPAGTTTLVDQYPEINTGDLLDPDPHWDLNYRQTNYYQVSTLFSDGTESACSDLMQVSLFPANAGSVLVSWSEPPMPVILDGTTPVTITGYVVRRATQSYHYELQWNRQWTVDNLTLSITDPNTDTTPTTACATAPIPGDTPDTTKPRYAFAGHTLKAILNVFVLKPNPLNEADPNTPIWLEMVVGTDWAEEIVEVNGNRYHTIVFNEQQRSATCEYYPVTANVEGATYSSDQDGIMIENADDIFDHIMMNVILNTYRSSVGPYAPSGGRWFTDVPYAPGLFDRSSIDQAKQVALTRIPGQGYLGAGALTEKIGARELIYELLVAYGLSLRQFMGVWSVKRFNPGVLARAGLPQIGPDEGIVEGSFEPEIDPSRHVNVIPFFAGPLSSGGGTESDGYYVSGEVRDPVSIDLFRQVLVTDPMYLKWTRDPPTAYSVVSWQLRLWRFPPINATFKGPAAWYGLPAGTEVRVTHPDGLSVAGWVNRVCEIHKIDLDLDGIHTTVRVRDIDDLVP